MRDRQGKLQLVSNPNINIARKKIRQRSRVKHVNTRSANMGIQIVTLLFFCFIRLPLYYSETKMIKLFDKISLISFVQFFACLSSSGELGFLAFLG